MENNEHKKLVKGIIDHFESKGLKIISAAYEGFEKCEIIGNHEPDVIATGSLLSLARLAGPDGEAAIRDGMIELTGDQEVALQFQDLLRCGRPDLEEELSGVVGDVIAHSIGEFARGVERWGKEARSTLRQNVSEYLQEESRTVPSRYEADLFRQQVQTLRDDVARFEARLKRLEAKREN